MGCWNERRWWLEDSWGPFKCRGAEQRDSSSVSREERRAYESLLELPLLKIFAGCLTADFGRLAPLTPWWPWGLPGLWHRWLGVCAPPGVFWVLLWVHLVDRTFPQVCLNPLVSLAEPQATSVNSELSHPGRSSQTHGVAALCFLLEMEALKFLSLLMLRL